MITKAATTATYGGAGSAIFGGLTANEFAAVAGVVIGVIGLLVNWYYKAQHLALARKNHQPDADD
jgi:hypothetical protein